MIGQTAEIVPADKKLYALRDATATIESIPLIVASIMSKKLAEGLDALVLDVKTGSGAFMREFEKSKQLAEALCQTGNACGVKTQAVITDMNQPLGEFVGNALEVYECVKILRGESNENMSPTLELSIGLTARMLVLSGATETIESAKQKIRNALDAGAALEKFRRNIELQGGNSEVCDEPEILYEKTLLEVQIKSPADGFVTAVDAQMIGRAVSAAGGGRLRVEDEIDYAVGYQCVRKIGDAVRRGEALGTLFCRPGRETSDILANLEMAYTIGEEKPTTISKLFQEDVR
jgi:pyrimidine-nucleoside phosphorylase